MADVVVWGTLFPVLQDETSLPSKSEIGVLRGSIACVPTIVRIVLLSLSLSPPLPRSPKGELQVLRTWFQSMTLSEACRKAADSVLMPKALLEFKSYLQKQPPPCLAMERATSNEPEVQPWSPAQPCPRAGPLWGWR